MQSFYLHLCPKAKSGEELNACNSLEIWMPAFKTLHFKPPGDISLRALPVTRSTHVSVDWWQFDQQPTALLSNWSLLSDMRENGVEQGYQSYQESLGHFYASSMFCSGFFSPSILFSLENPTQGVFQLMLHHNWYISARCFTKSALFVVCFFFSGNKLFHQKTTAQLQLWLFSSEIWGLPGAEQICPLLLQVLAPGYFLKTSSRMLWSLWDLMDICQEVLQCHILLGEVAGWRAFEIVEWSWWRCAFLGLCAGWASCLLAVPSKQRMHGEMGSLMILAAFLFGCQCSWSRGSSAAGHSLSLLSGFADSEIMCKEKPVISTPSTEGSFGRVLTSRWFVSAWGQRHVLSHLLLLSVIAFDCELVIFVLAVICTQNCIGFESQQLFAPAHLWACFFS